ncbi:leucine-rich repeat domain-containing protein [Formosa undariae]|uniref:Leucine-rich repeat domain-containing protein n=1 Tax=Formosa undariae TaxID=1325436 RepID=A0ABV5EZZ3_9FLAO
MKKTLLSFIMLLAVTFTYAQLAPGEIFYDASFNFQVTTLEDAGSPNTVSLTGIADGANVPNALVIPATVNQGGIDYAITLISSQAFKSTSVTSLVIEGDTEPGHQSFMGCVDLTSISLPLSSKIGAQAFRDCTALTTTSLPNVLSVDVQTFRNCTALTSISLPSLISLGAGEGAGLTFWQCANLQTIDIPSVEAIYVGAFNAAGLTSITLPTSLTVLDETNYNIFRNITTLTQVTVENPTPIALTYSDPTDTTSSIFATTLGSANLTVPNGSLAAYQAAEVWKDFASITEATLSIDSNEKAVFKSYPNPVNDRLYFSSKAIASVEIYNLLGSKIASQKVNDGVDTSALSKGMYLVRCQDAEGKNVATVKVIKQ